MIGYRIVRADDLSSMRREINGLTARLSDTVSFVEQLTKGNYGLTVPVGDALIYRSLECLSTELRKLEEKEKQQAWQSEGLALFMEILKSSSGDLHQLSERIITALVKYLKSNQGGFFVVEEHESVAPVIKLMGCYAYGRKKFEQKVFEPGQGLLGQVYLEKTPTYLKQVPNNYTSITSGLGAATPSCILIVPLQINGKVMAIVELASFTAFEEYEIQFIEKLGENIAAVIETNVINRRTEQLLKDSQQFVGQLRAQEEEMRQNMEELTAMHENQTRLQAELSERVNDLESAKKQIEEFKEAEAVKMRRQNAVQTQIMNTALEKFKRREAELQERVNAYENELQQLERPFITNHN